MFREGLSFVISQMNGFRVVGEADSGDSFLGMIDELEVDIVLMDISMPGIDGVTATAMALEKYPDLRIIALTMFCDEVFYCRMIQSGVSGYILKESGKDELAKALNTVAAGEKYFSQKLLHNIIVNSNINRGQSDMPAPGEIKLTLRENEILKLICQGLTNTQISEKLSLSLRTIEAFKSDLMNKTGVKNPVGLAVYAMKHHLVDI